MRNFDGRSVTSPCIDAFAWFARFYYRNYKACSFALHCTVDALPSEIKCAATSYSIAAES
jgi:hypothetical protein